MAIHQWHQFRELVPKFSRFQY